MGEFLVSVLPHRRLLFSANNNQCFKCGMGASDVYHTVSPGCMLSRPLSLHELNCARAQAIKYGIVPPWLDPAVMGRPELERYGWFGIPASLLPGGQPFVPTEIVARGQR